MVNNIWLSKFDKSTVRLYFIPILSMLADFQENQISITMFINQMLDFKFLYFKIIDKIWLYGK